MSVLHYDAEVFSEVDLREAGVYKYAEHESTELLMLTFRFDAGVPRLWLPYNNVPMEFIGQLRTLLGDKAILIVGTEVPREIVEHIERGGQVRSNTETPGQVRAHNSQYERVVLNAVAGRKLEFPHVKIEQTVCTMAKAQAAGMPAALGDCAKALGTPAKDDAGRISMLQITKPRKPTKDDPSTRWTIANAPEKWLDVLVYNVDDVLAECGVDAALPELTTYEQKVYYFDQRMNERGVGIDREGIHFVIALREEYKRFLELAMEKATRPKMSLGCGTCRDTRKVEKRLRGKPTGASIDCPECFGLEPSQREKIADWVRANGWPNLLDMQADTVRKLVARADVPDNVKHVLRLYSTYGASAVSKFDAMLAAACADGRLRGMFMYHGAGPGRWSSRIVNLQSLFRPVIDDPETAVVAFRSKSLDWIKALWPDTDPMKVFASTVRQHLIAAPGKKFVCLDYSGVESRYNAWVWNEAWKVEAFRKSDAGEGPDLYRIARANVFGGDPREVTKKQRQEEGKPLDLFGQYGGGVGAFVNMAAQYGTNLAEMTESLWPRLSEDLLDSAAWMWNKYGRHGSELPERVYLACDAAKQLWRRAHPATVQGWKDLETAAELAVQFPGKAYPIAGGKGCFRVMKGPQGHEWLTMVLPSRQRMIHYYKPEWTPPKKMLVNVPILNDHGQPTQHTREEEREIPGELHYYGVDTDTRRYMRTSAYGGAWNNNWVQGGCADLIRSGMFEMEDGGYPIVLTVHDEGGAEVDESFGSVEDASVRFCTPRAWFAGLPLVAEGWAGKRYRK